MDPGAEACGPAVGVSDIGPKTIPLDVTPRWDPAGPRWSEPVRHELRVLVLKPGASGLDVGDEVHVSTLYRSKNVDRALDRFGDELAGYGDPTLPVQQAKVMALDCFPAAPHTLHRSGVRRTIDDVDGGES